MSIEIDGTWCDEYTASDLIRECGEQTGDAWEEDGFEECVHHFERWSFGSETFTLCWTFTKEVYEKTKEDWPDRWQEELPYDNGTCHVVEI
mgnify:FL=1